MPGLIIVLLDVRMVLAYIFGKNGGSEALGLYAIAALLFDNVAVAAAEEVTFCSGDETDSSVPSVLNRLRFSSGRYGTTSRQERGFLTTC